MTKSAEAIALAYLDAVAKKELDRVASLVTSDVRFVGPGTSFTGAADLLAAFRRIGVIHVRSDIKRVFSDGNDVCVIYDFVTDTAGPLPCVEWLHLEGGKICEVKLFYDQVPWIEIRKEMTRRAAQATA
jgi:hypothetical protein